MGFIKQVRIRNFRNLEDCTFEIRPLTLLLGPNGSGKSTFLKALLFLGKNINEEKRSDECLFDITDDIKLGSFEEIATNGDVSKSIVFDFIFNLKGLSDYIQKDFWVTKRYTISKRAGENTVNFDSEYDDSIEGFEENIYDVKGFEYLKYLFEEPEIENDTKEDPTTKIDKFFNRYPESYGKFEKTNYYKTKRTDYILKIAELTHKKIDERILWGPDASQETIDLWESYSEKQKNEYYVRYRKIFFLLTFYNEKLEKLLNEFLKIKHLPTVRKPFRNSYLLSNGEFNEQDNKDNNGILGYLENDMKHSFLKEKIFDKEFIVLEGYYIASIIMLCVKFRLDLKYLVDFNLIKANLREVIKNINDLLTNAERLEETGEMFMNTSHLGIKTKEEILKNIKKALKKIKKTEYNNLYSQIRKSTFFNWLLTTDDIYSIDKENNSDPMISHFQELLMPYFDIAFLYDSVSLSNYWLNKMGFSKSIMLEKEKPLARFLVYKIDPENKKILGKPYNASYESSGFQQIYPVILYMADIISNLKHHLLDSWSEQPEPVYLSLFIEQPELHMHPALQSKFTELFADYILLSRDLYNSENTVLYIETHSEHIVRKLQLMVAKNEISLGDVALNYVNNKNNRAAVTYIRISENGNFLDPWPNGFFDEASELTYELLKAQSNRNN